MNAISAENIPVKRREPEGRMNTIAVENIPLELRKLNQWILWRCEIRKKKPTKVPYQAANGKEAATTRPNEWANFDLAHQRFLEGGYDGIGFVLTENDPIAGVDLDHCVDAQTRIIEPWAIEVIREQNSYTEFSPSGTGIRIFEKGKLPPEGRKKGNVEMYDAVRYLTVTGNHLQGTPQTIENRQLEITALHARIFNKVQAESKSNGNGHRPQPLELADEEILSKARNAANGDKFRALYDAGEWAGYPSHSEADSALCMMLAFYCGRNENAIDRLFRQSGLMRDKWDSKRGQSSYGADTIRKACKNTGETYRGPQSATSLPKQSIPQTEQADKSKVDLLPYLNNDHGNAERVKAYCGENMRFCHPLKKFLIWQGRRWRPDTTKQAHRLAKKAMLAYMAQAVEAGSEAHEKFARQSLDAKRINSMLDMLQSELFAEPAELDRDPYILNCLNGTVDLRTGQLLPHDRNQMITKIIEHAYDPSAKCPKLLVFLYRIMGMGRDPDRAERLVKYLQKAVGYSLTGVTNEKVCFILWGSGNNGKTTFLALIRRILGEYAGLLQIETLMARREESNNTQSDLADLRGLRFVMTSETEEGQRLAEGKLKRITQGMGTIKAARKYENGIEFEETHKLWMDANHKPVVRGTDNAIWNRLHLIPFIVEIPKAEQDPDLSDKLLSEAEGILAWAVQGAVSWYSERLEKPPDVEKAGEEWRAESDALKDFIEECCILAATSSCRSSDLWKAYEKWAEDNGEKRLLTRIKLAERLQSLGCKRDRSTQARTWRGIGLLA